MFLEPVGVREMGNRKTGILTSEKTVERLSLYRRLLFEVLRDGTRSIYSHQLAERVGGTATQVRRDLMILGFGGNSKRGYEVEGLVEKIGEFLDNPVGEPVVLVGLGNLGRALLPFFATYRPNLRFVAAFDVDPLKVGRVIHGCRCQPVDRLEDVIRELRVRVAVVAVPAAQAQQMATRLVAAGISGILNFAPVPVHVPPGAYVEAVDITTSLEKAAFMAKRLSEGLAVQKGAESCL
jgi:redox-sensing transcriptional repressor